MERKGKLVPLAGCVFSASFLWLEIWVSELKPRHDYVDPKSGFFRDVKCLGLTNTWFWEILNTIFFPYSWTYLQVQSPISIFNYDVPSNLTEEIQKKGNHSNLIFALSPKAASSKLPFVTAFIRRRRQLFNAFFFKYVKPSLTQWGPWSLEIHEENGLLTSGSQDLSLY